MHDSDAVLQVHLILEDAAGNIMREPYVVPFTSGPDTLAPQIYLRQPCSVSTGQQCPDPGTAQFCNNVEANSVSAHAYSDEAGATYFALTKLPSDDWDNCNQALPDLDPGEVFRVPPGEQWQGCTRRSSAQQRVLSAVRSMQMSEVSQPASAAALQAAAAFDSGSAARSLQQESLVPQPGCMAQQPCDCCKVSVNCAVPFNTLWADRADIQAAGDVLVSACAYMWASTCAEVPIERALSLAAPSLVSRSDAAAPAAVSSAGSTDGTRSLFSASDAVPYHGLWADQASSQGVQFSASSWLAQQEHRHSAREQTAVVEPYATRVLQQLSVSEMELEMGSNTTDASDAAYRQPMYLNTSMLQDGLEADSYYALFLVTEDGMRPEPNRLSPAQQYFFRTQSPWAPSCSVACDPQRATLDSVLLTASMNTTGTLCFAVLASDSTATPSVQQVCTLGQSTCTTAAHLPCQWLSLSAGSFVGLCSNCVLNVLYHGAA